MSGTQTNLPAKATQTDIAVRAVHHIEKQIRAALPRAIDAGRFVRIVSTAIRLNPDLAACTRESLLGCVLQAAQWGLAVNDGLGAAYLIPRNQKVKGRDGRDEWVKTCTLQVGYKGLRKLAKRSAGVSDIFSGTVYDRDIFTYRACPLDLLHEPYIGSEDRGKPRCYYAAAYREARLVAVQIILPADAEAARQRSDAGKKDTGPWASDYDAMARKTAIRRLCTQQLDLEADDLLGRAARVDEAAEFDQPQEFDVGVIDAVHEVEVDKEPKRLDLPVGRLDVEATVATTVVG